MDNLENRIKEIEKLLAESSKTKLELEDRVANLVSALEFYKTATEVISGEKTDIGDIARDALADLPDQNYYTRLEKAENENTAFCILITSLLKDLKGCEWEDDYNTTMLNEMIAVNTANNSDKPTIAELAAIHTLYASSLEGMCNDLADLIDPEGINKIGLRAVMLAAYNKSFDQIMSNRK